MFGSLKVHINARGVSLFLCCFSKYGAVRRRARFLGKPAPEKRKKLLLPLFLEARFPALFSFSVPHCPAPGGAVAATLVFSDWSPAQEWITPLVGGGRQFIGENNLVPLNTFVVLLFGLPFSKRSGACSRRFLSYELSIFCRLCKPPQFWSCFVFPQFFFS